MRGGRGAEPAGGHHGEGRGHRQHGRHRPPQPGDRQDQLPEPDRHTGRHRSGGRRGGQDGGGAGHHRLGQRRAD